MVVLRKPGPELHQRFLDVLTFLGRRGLTVLVERWNFGTLPAEPGYEHVFPFEPEVAPKLYGAVDFVINLGGDGLILHAAALFGAAIPPLISFKLGSLGFLTCHRHERLLEHLDEVLGGARELAVAREGAEGGPRAGPLAVRGVPITLRMRLSCRVVRRDGRQERPVEVLNEVVLSRGAHPYLCSVEIFERENLVTQARPRGEGVILH